MLRLRTYKSADADVIVKWCRDEAAFRRWTSDRYESFPITAEDMNAKYMDNNGDCIEPDNFYPVTAFDESGVVGHMIMRYTDEEKSVLRFGFVIVDDAKRGMGYGKGMINLALKYAFDIFGAKKVTLGVFENNDAAYYCYKAAGFRDIETDEKEICNVCGERWEIREMELIREDYDNQK